MSNKGRLNRNLKGLQRIKTWQLVVLLIIVGFVAATFLRMNNIGMVERRAAVMVADEQGDSEVTLQRLYDLQTYVSSHMNTDLGSGVYLISTHSRDVEKWNSERYSGESPHGNIFVKAQSVCEPRFSTWSPAYVQCVVAELEKFPPADDIGGESSEPTVDMYRYSYASPLWSADFAGWSVLAFGIILVLIIVRLLTIGVLHLMLRRRYKNI